MHELGPDGYAAVLEEHRRRLRAAFAANGVLASAGRADAAARLLSPAPTIHADIGWTYEAWFATLDDGPSSVPAPLSAKPASLPPGSRLAP